MFVNLFALKHGGSRWEVDDRKEMGEQQSHRKLKLYACQLSFEHGKLNGKLVGQVLNKEKLMENQRFTHQFTLIFRKVVQQKQLNAIRIKKKTQIDRCGY